MTKPLLSPLVGTSFRDNSTRKLLSLLPEGQPLVLTPEPSNPYDPEAVRVSVELSEVNLVVNSETENLIQSILESDAPQSLIHLGYLPQSGGRFDTLKCGNHEAILFMKSHPYNWSASLTFDPQGRPLVRLSSLEHLS